LDSVPLDVVTIAQATAYCSCPSVIEVDQVNFKSMDISKILTKKMPQSAKNTLSLVATPQVIPQTSYMSSGLVLAAIIAGGFVYRKNTSEDKKSENDIFSALV
jgi:hypothetical protein